MAAKSKLSPKQQLFIEHYLVSLNASEAAEKAGYRQPNKQGPRLLVNVGVAAAIADAVAAQKKRVEVEADVVLRELLLIATSDIGQVLDFSKTEPRLRPACEIPENARRALASVKVKRTLEGAGDEAREVEVTEFRFWDKLGALDKLARRLGIYAPVKVAPTDPSGKKPYDAGDLRKLSAEELLRLYREALAAPAAH